MRLNPFNDLEAVCYNPRCRSCSQIVYCAYKEDAKAYKPPPEVTVENIQAALPDDYMCPRVCAEALKKANMPLKNLNHAVYCVPKEGYSCECQRIIDEIGGMRYEEIVEEAFSEIMPSNSLKLPATIWQSEYFLRLKSKTKTYSNPRLIFGSKTHDAIYFEIVEKQVYVKLKLSKDVCWSFECVNGAYHPLILLNNRNRKPGDVELDWTLCLVGNAEIPSTIFVETKLTTGKQGKSRSSGRKSQPPLIKALKVSQFDYDLPKDLEKAFGGLRKREYFEKLAASKEGVEKIIVETCYAFHDFWNQSDHEMALFHAEMEIGSVPDSVRAFKLALCAVLKRDSLFQRDLEHMSYAEAMGFRKSRLVQALDKLEEACDIRAQCAKKFHEWFNSWIDVTIANIALIIIEQGMLEELGSKLQFRFQDLSRDAILEEAESILRKYKKKYQADSAKTMRTLNLQDLQANEAKMVGVIEQKLKDHDHWVRHQGTAESESIQQVKHITNNVKSLMHYLWLQIEAGGDMEKVKRLGIDWASSQLKWIEKEWARKERKVRKQEMIFWKLRFENIQL